MRFIGSWLAPRLRQMHFFVLLSFIGFLFPALGHAGISSIVVEAGNGEVLQEEGADERRYPASLTKMMTLYMVFKALDSGKLSLDQRFRISRYAASRPPTKLGLRPGQRVRLEELILGLVTRSANDAAVAIAEGMAGTEKAFARRMTAQARELGMASTAFQNASGLPDRRQYTTARDMARLAGALLQEFPEHYGFFSTRRFAFRGQVYRNHNRLLENYPGADGIKTGYIRASGYNLAASAMRHGKRVVAVVLGGKSPLQRDRVMVGLLDSAFDTLAATPGRREKPAIQAAQPSGSIEPAS